MRAYTIKNNITIISILACGLYSFFLGLCFYFDTVQEKKTTMEVARNRALTVYKKDLAFRSWAVEHGGVYIVQDGVDSPHRHLKTTPEREFLTPSGKKLVLVNPASILQQVSENFNRLNKGNNQLPSLKIIDGNTTTDGWESEAAARISAGSQEVFLTALSRKDPIFRLIKPIRLRQNCLRCHGPDGYREGDIKSIVSITVPLQPYLKKEQENIKFLFLLHFAFW
ncbi:c-type heme family protein, partial [Desulfomarina sp.]